MGKELESLKELRIDGNQMKTIKFLGSKESIEFLSAKYDLCSRPIRNNCLTDAENAFELVNLSHLYLDHNQLTNVSKGINNCRLLRTLSLGNNKITE